MRCQVPEGTVAIACFGQDLHQCDAYGCASCALAPVPMSTAYQSSRSEEPSRIANSSANAPEPDAPAAPCDENSFQPISPPRSSRCGPCHRMGTALYATGTVLSTRTAPVCFPFTNSFVVNTPPQACLAVCTTGQTDLSRKG